MNIRLDEQHTLTYRALYGPRSTEVTSVRFDSRKVSDNDAFFCIQGENHNGHDFIEQALKQGAGIVVGSDTQLLQNYSTYFPDRTFLAVDDVRLAMAQMAIIVSNHAYKKLTTIGVTGTNGKTTVVAYIRSLLDQLHTPATSIGTCGIITSKEKMMFDKSTPTTPESSDLHYLFELLYEQGEKAAVMEATSIGLEQRRTAGIDFDVAVHTNISTEHLEFHKTFANYKEAKLKLFRQAKRAVVNVDDNGMAADILEAFNGKLLTYSLDTAKPADVYAVNIVTETNGTSFDLLINGNVHPVQAPVFGTYNVANLLATVCTALLLDYPLNKIIEALTAIESPEGRFEIVEREGRRIILDYAHTPVALDNLLHAVKMIPHERLIAMIMGIGIRDRGKMPKMAATIEGRANDIVVSVDHPGYNDPNDIIAAVCSGFSDHADAVSKARTRKEAVIKSLELSRPGDIVLLTGGTINGAQLVRGEAIPHSDKEIIDTYFSELHSEAKKTSVS